MKTLLLDRDSWDLLLDAAGNWAVASDPYAIAQNVANACRLFKGELYYNTAKGMPYFQKILGQNPPLSYVRAQYVAQAVTVAGVVQAKCVITSFKNRQYNGIITVIDTVGQSHNVSF